MSRLGRVLSRSRLGLRGAFLLCLAALDVVYGWSLFNPTAETMRGAAYEWRDQFMPSQDWGLLWIAAGVFIASYAWARVDRVGYSVAIGLKFFWATVAYASWLAGDVKQGWNLGTIFLCFGGLALIASLSPEGPAPRNVAPMPEDLHVPEEPTERPGDDR